MSIAEKIRRHERRARADPVVGQAPAVHWGLKRLQCANVGLAVAVVGVVPWHADGRERRIARRLSFLAR
jgi:hypothetical protein